MDDCRDGLGAHPMEPAEHPLVSIYLPTRDRPLMAERAIRSVAAQTYPNIQLVVVDDGSAADTMSRLRQLKAECGPRLNMEIIRQATSQGACGARNLALSACDGIYVTGLDDDDYFSPGRIAALVAAFVPARMAFVFDGYVRETVTPDGSVRRSAVPLLRRVTLRHLLMRNYIGNQVLTLTSRMREVSGFDTNLPAWQDYDLWLRLVRTYGEAVGLGGTSYYQTVNMGKPSISADHGAVDRAREIFIRKHLEYTDPILRSCLNLSLACYGRARLSAADLANISHCGAPYLLLSAAYFFVRNRL